jgi:hypothetical protein
VEKYANLKAIMRLVIRHSTRFKFYIDPKKMLLHMISGVRKIDIYISA